jgi:hypothetical protein
MRNIRRGRCQTGNYKENPTHLLPHTDFAQRLKKIAADVAVTGLNDKRRNGNRLFRSDFSGEGTYHRLDRNTR